MPDAPAVHAPDTAAAPAHAMACHDCDLLQALPPLAPGTRARCLRCGAVLGEARAHSLERSLALALAGLILFVLANTLPFLSLTTQGQIQDSNLISGALTLIEEDRLPLGVLVFLTTFAFPLADLTGTLWLLLGARNGHLSATSARVFRFLRSAQPWGMLEIFLLGVLVSAVKLGDVARVVPGTALFAFVALVGVLAALAATLDSHQVWSRVTPENQA